MVLVDTSVWIDFLQDPDSRHAAALEALILENNRAVTCGIILQEILQGIKDEKNFTLTKDRLFRLPYIDIDKATYLYASSLYRMLRAKGITIPAVDVTIASLAVRRGIPLYTKDDHFKSIARHAKLKLFSSAS